MYVCIHACLYICPSYHLYVCFIYSSVVLSCPLVLPVFCICVHAIRFWGIFSNIIYGQVGNKFEICHMICNLKCCITFKHGLWWHSRDCYYFYAKVLCPFKYNNYFMCLIRILEERFERVYEFSLYTLIYRQIQITSHNTSKTPN